MVSQEETPTGAGQVRGGVRGEGKQAEDSGEGAAVHLSLLVTVPACPQL